MTDNQITDHTVDNPSPLHPEDKGFHRAPSASMYLGLLGPFTETELARWSAWADAQGVPLTTWCMAQLREGAAHYRRVHRHD